MCKRGALGLWQDDNYSWSATSVISTIPISATLGFFESFGVGWGGEGVSLNVDQERRRMSSQIRKSRLEGSRARGTCVSETSDLSSSSEGVGDLLIERGPTSWTCLQQETRPVELGDVHDWSGKRSSAPTARKAGWKPRSAQDFAIPNYERRVQRTRRGHHP